MESKKGLEIEIIGFPIKYVTPQVPNKKDIFGSNLPTKKQKWVRPVLPDDEEIKAYSIEDTIALIKREFIRRVEGFWFMNNGEATYITGAHYFFLTHWYISAETEDGYPEYRRAGRFWFYVIDICDNDPLCAGAIMGCNKRFGKALDLDTKIPTPNGWRTMRDIHVGDTVFGSSGKPTLVTFESEIQHNRDCYEITFSDKSKVIADAEHRWVASNAKDRTMVTKAIYHTKRLKEVPKQIVTTHDMFVSQRSNQDNNNWSIENCAPVEYTEKQLNIPPYILGIWLGDGNSRQAKITSIDGGIIQSWKDYGRSIGLNCVVYDSDKISYALSGGMTGGKKDSNVFTKYLSDYNLFENKHIPLDYLQSSVEQRTELLRGLMDTDGTINKTVNFFEYCSKIESLRDNVYELIVSLGFKCRRFSKLNKKYNKTYYYLNFGGHHINPFKLKRKADRFESKRGVGGIRQHFRYIEAIVKVESRPVKCIQVDNETHTYLCGESFIPTHNTEMALAHLYNRATLTIKNKLFGLNSLSAAEAKNNLFKERIMRSHKLIPNYLKPVSNETKSRREITSALTFRGNNLGGGKYSDALNNIIDHRPTLVSAYQGKKPAEVLFDEMGSVTEISPKAWWRTVKQQLVVGTKVTGKCYLPTTLETMESIGAQEFKEIFRESDMYKRDANGRTQSYLYPYFKPHYQGREGFIDEYGNDLEEEAKKWRQNELDGADEVGKYTIKRQYPETEEEMFYVANDESQLNMQNIEDQLNFNEANPHLSAWGNLEWIDGVVDNPLGVKWIPTGSERTGRWNFMKLPTTPNLQIWKNGLRTPDNGDMGANGVIGVDPTAGVRAYAKRQSDLAMFGWEFMRFGDPFSDCPIFDYCCRTPDPNAGFEDVIKTLVFLGMPAHIERNREALIKHLEMRGYNNYVLDRPAFSISEKSENKKDKGKGTPNTGAPFRNMLFTGLKGTIQNKCGFQTVINDEGKEIREMSKWYLSRSLKHLKEFKPFEEWNDFDLAVAEMFAVILRIQYIVPKVKPRELFKINVPTYKTNL